MINEFDRLVREFRARIKEAEEETIRVIAQRDEWRERALEAERLACLAVAKLGSGLSLKSLTELQEEVRNWKRAVEDWRSLASVVAVSGAVAILSPLIIGLAALEAAAGRGAVLHVRAVKA